MALEVAELSCQFVADFAFKVVCVNTAGVAVDVVLSDVVLANWAFPLAEASLAWAIWMPLTSLNTAQLWIGSGW